MGFIEESGHYRKTALSELQGAWESLRDEVVRTWPFPESQRILFHIDEGMSWESVRNLKSMRGTLLLIENITRQGACPDAVVEDVDMVRQNLEDVFQAIASGELM